MVALMILLCIVSVLGSEDGPDFCFAGAGSGDLCPEGTYRKEDWTNDTFELFDNQEEIRIMVVGQDIDTVFDTQTFANNHSFTLYRQEESFELLTTLTFLFYQVKTLTIHSGVAVFSETGMTVDNVNLFGKTKFITKKASMVNFVNMSYDSEFIPTYFDSNIFINSINIFASNLKEISSTASLYRFHDSNKAYTIRMDHRAKRTIQLNSIQDNFCIRLDGTHCSGMNINLPDSKSSLSSNIQILGDKGRLNATEKIELTNGVKYKFIVDEILWTSVYVDGVIYKAIDKEYDICLSNVSYGFGSCDGCSGIKLTDLTPEALHDLMSKNNNVRVYIPYSYQGVNVVISTLGADGTINFTGVSNTRVIFFGASKGDVTIAIENINAIASGQYHIIKLVNSYLAPGHSFSVDMLTMDLFSASNLHKSVTEYGCAFIFVGVIESFSIEDGKFHVGEWLIPYENRNFIFAITTRVSLVIDYSGPKAHPPIINITQNYNSGLEILGDIPLEQMYNERLRIFYPAKKMLIKAPKFVQLVPYEYLSPTKATETSNAVDFTKTLTKRTTDAPDHRPLSASFVLAIVFGSIIALIVLCLITYFCVCGRSCACCSSEDPFFAPDVMSYASGKAPLLLK